MPKFMILYMAPIAAIEQMNKATPEQKKAGMDAWMKWAAKNEKGILDKGAPLGKTRRVTSTGAADTRNEITGYSLVQGGSLAAVAKMFEGHPHLGMVKGASINVIECVSLDAM